MINEFNLTNDNTDEFRKFLKQSKIDIKEQKSFVMTLINPWLEQMEQSSMSENDKLQKKKELIDLANFIQVFDSTIEIADGLCEKPDFIIKYKTNIIGVELVDVYHNLKAKEKEGVFNKFFNEIEVELLSYSVNYNGIYRINFSKGLNTLNRKVREELKPIIITAIINNEQPQSDYISSIVKTKHTGIHLYAGNTIMLGDLKRSVISRVVNQKEHLLSGYNCKNLDEIWLLMIIPGIQESSDYDGIEDDILSTPFATGFNQLFLFDFFSRDLFKLNIN